MTRSLVTPIWESRAVSSLGAGVAEGVGEADAAVARLLVVMERTRSRSSELAMGMARLMSLLGSTSVETGELLRVRSEAARQMRLQRRESTAVRSASLMGRREVMSCRSESERRLRQSTPLPSASKRMPRWPSMETGGSGSSVTLDWKPGSASIAKAVDGVLLGKPTYARTPRSWSSPLPAMWVGIDGGDEGVGGPAQIPNRASTSSSLARISANISSVVIMNSGTVVRLPGSS
jgi:hypothetical protein